MATTSLVEWIISEVDPDDAEIVMKQLNSFGIRKLQHLLDFDPDDQSHTRILSDVLTMFGMIRFQKSVRNLRSANYQNRHKNEQQQLSENTEELRRANSISLNVGETVLEEIETDIELPIPSSENTKSYHVSDKCADNYNNLIDQNITNDIIQACCMASADQEQHQTTVDIPTDNHINAGTEFCDFQILNSEDGVIGTLMSDQGNHAHATQRVLSKNKEAVQKRDYRRKCALRRHVEPEYKASMREKWRIRKRRQRSRMATNSVTLSSAGDERENLLSDVPIDLTNSNVNTRTEAEHNSNSHDTNRITRDAESKMKKDKNDLGETLSDVATLEEVIEMDENVIASSDDIENSEELSIEISSSENIESEQGTMNDDLDILQASHSIQENEVSVRKQTGEAEDPGSGSRLNKQDVVKDRIDRNNDLKVQEKRELQVSPVNSSSNADEDYSSSISTLHATTDDVLLPYELLLAYPPCSEMCNSPQTIWTPFSSLSMISPKRCHTPRFCEKVTRKKTDRSCHMLKMSVLMRQEDIHHSAQYVHQHERSSLVVKMTPDKPVTQKEQVITRTWAKCLSDPIDSIDFLTTGDIIYSTLLKVRVLSIHGTQKDLPFNTSSKLAYMHLVAVNGRTGDVALLWGSRFTVYSNINSQWEFSSHELHKRDVTPNGVIWMSRSSIAVWGFCMKAKSYVVTRYQTLGNILSVMNLEKNMDVIDVAVDSTGDLYILYKNGEECIIKVYDTEQKYREIQLCKSKINLGNIQAICMDENDKILVLDVQTHKAVVTRWGLDGCFLGTVVEEDHGQIFNKEIHIRRSQLRVNQKTNAAVIMIHKKSAHANDTIVMVCKV